MNAREELRLRIERDLQAVLKPYTHYSARTSGYAAVVEELNRLIRKYREAIGSDIDNFRARVFADVSKDSDGHFIVQVSDERSKPKRKYFAMIIEWPFLKKDERCVWCDGRAIEFDKQGNEIDCRMCKGTGREA